MNAATRQQLLKELAARGYREDGASPFRSIVLDYDELAETALGELFDQMVVRRETILRSLDALGREVALQQYEDAQRAIDAMKVVLERLTE